MRKNLNMLKPIFIAALAAAVFAAGAPAQTGAETPQKNEKPPVHNRVIIDGKIDNNADPDFIPQLIASTQDPDFDAWLKMPKNAVPQISTVKKV